MNSTQSPKNQNIPFFNIVDQNSTNTTILEGNNLQNNISIQNITHEINI